jgi:predicted anti-sigma-YlaC factor YlaD
MRIDCNHVWEYISAYIDNDVDPEVRTDIDRHLETCEICSAVLDSTRNVVILVADERVFELPAGFSERLHAHIEREI